MVGKNLKKEIKEKVNTKNADFYFIPLINFIGKKKIIKGWMACLAHDGKFCLFRRGIKSWVDGSVHPRYNLEGRKGETFINTINHYMSKDISDLLLKFNRNTTLYARDLKFQGNNLAKLFSIRKIFSRFIKSFFSRKGFKSGRIGFLIGVLCAIYPYVSAIKSRED